MYIVGIAGGTASGKTTFAELLCHALGDALIISMDCYYRDLSGMSADERNRVDFDHPDSLEHELLETHLLALKKGEKIECPTYDFATHSRTEITTTVCPSKYLIVEGILTFHWPELRDLFDYKIFIDASEKVRLERRMERDIKVRGRSPESVMTQWNTTVQRGYLNFCEPCKRYAEFVANGELPKQEMLYGLPLLNKDNVGVK